MATYTVVNSGGSINNAATFSPAGVPGATDTIAFTTTSGQLTVNTSTTIQDINFSDYKNVITFNASLTVTRNITLADAGGNATYTTASATNLGIIKLGAGTITSNGRVWDRKLTISTSGGSGTSPYTLTMADVFNISGDLVHNNSSDVTIISSNFLDVERFNILGNYSGTSVGFLISGGQAAAVTIRFTGSANQTITMRLGLNTKIDKSGGTLTITGTNFFQTNTLTYVAGTVDTTGSILTVRNSATYNVNGDSSPSATTVSSTGINWDIVDTSVGSPTLSILSNFTIKTSLTIDNALTVTFTRPSGSGNVYLGGNLIMGTSTNATLSSSAVTIIMNGTGNWSGGGTVAAPLTFDTTGTITVVGVAGGGDIGVVQFNTGTLTYLNGTIVTTNSTLRFLGSCTLATSGMTWNIIEAGISATITLNQNLVFTSTLKVLNKTAVGGTVTFTSVGGANLIPSLTSGFTLGSTSANGNTTINFPASSVYNIDGVYVGTDGATNIGYNMTINNVTLNISGNLTIQYTNQNISRLSGTSTQINMVGTGTVSVSRIGGNNLFYIAVPFSVNTSGTITFTSTVNSVVYFEGKTITYVSGTTTTSNGSAVAFITGCSMNFNETNQWGVDIFISGNLTLLSNATVTNFSTYGGGTVMTGAFTINIKGNLAINATTSGASTPIIINGTGAQTWSHGSAVYLSNNLTINKSSGDLTVSGNVYYVTGTLTYTTAGGVTTTGSTLNIGGSCTLATNGITWANINTSVTATITLTNNLVWSTNWISTAGTITFSGVGTLAPVLTANIAFSGTAAVTIKNALSLTALTVTSSGTTTLTGDLTCTGLVTLGAGGVATTLSSSGGARTIIATNGITIGSTTGFVVCNINIKVTGGTITGNSTLSGGYLTISTTYQFEIDGNVTFSPTNALQIYGGVTTGTGGTFKYTSGTVTTTGSSIWINGINFDSGAIAWNNVWFLSGSASITVLQSNVTVNGLLTLGYLTFGFTINNNGTTKTITAAGGITLLGSTSVVSGTANITCTGGTITGISSVQLRLNLTLNGNITFASGVTFSYNTGTLTYTSGTITTTNSTLSVATSTTFATNGMVWNIINWSGGALTLTNALTATGLITVSHQGPVLNGSDLYANGGMTFTGINLSGNLAFISGTSTIRFEGTGSWASTQRGTYQNNIIINPTSNSFTVSDVYYALGTITYNSSNGGRVTSAVLTLGYYNAISSRGLSRSVTFNTNEMRWDYILCMSYTDVGVTISTITCLSNLNVNYFGFVGIGSAASDTWNFSLSTGANLVNVGNFNIDARATVNLVKDFTTRTLSFSTGIFGRLNNNTVTVTDLLTSSAASGAVTWTGTAKLILGNNCTWTRTDNLGPISFNMEFQGNLNVGSTAFPLMTFNASSLTYTGKNVESATVRGSLQIASNATLLNFNKVTFTNLIIVSGLSLTMNEFFSGRANQKSIISASSTTNYTITFNDSLEKLAFYVKVSRATISRTNQLTVVTNRGNNGNNVNIKFAPNQLPNGLPKNNPLVSNQSQLGSFLLSEPIYN